MKQALSKSDISQIKEIDLNKVFGLIKSETSFPEKNQNSQLSRNTLAVILKYAKKYKIDIHNVLNLQEFISIIETQSQDFYDLWIANEIKKILKISEIDESEKLYAHILRVLEQEKSDILSSYIKAIDNSAIVQIIGVDGIVRYVNDMYKRVSWDERKLIWKAVSAMWWKLYHKSMFWKDLRDTLLSGNIWQWMIENPRIDKKWESYVTYTTITPVKNDLWEIIEFIAIKFDITQAKKFERQLIESNKRFHNIIDSTSQWFWIIDKELTILDLNESLCRMIWYTKNELIWKNIRDLLDEKNKETLNEQVVNIETSVNRKYYLDFTRKDGTYLPVVLKATSLYYDDGNFKEAIAFITDISEIREYQQKLYDISIKDELTGIWNRRLFDIKLKTYFEQCKKGLSETKNVSIAILDIDFFKRINDGLWHDIGDIVLKEFWERLLHISRENIEVYRVGWEEFWILWFNISQQDFLKIVDDFRFYNQWHPIIYPKWKIQFTISWWIAHFDQENNKIKSPQDFFKKADILLYAAKNSGKNNIKSPEDI